MLYTPRHNLDDDPASIAAFVRDEGFGALVSVGPDGTPWATHVPVLLDTTDALPTPEAPWTLALHMARANAHSRALQGGADVLFVVQGPHAYVSAATYAPAGSVSTWNYVAVHLRGTARTTEDPEALRATVERLTRVYESEAMLRTPGYDDRLLGAIVGVTVTVTGVEARVKMSQDKPDATYARIVDHLGASPRAGDRATADLMRRRRPGASADVTPGA